MGKNQKKQVKVKENNWMELLPLLLLAALQPLTAIGKKVAVWLADYPWFPNVDYQYDILENPDFQAGNTDVEFIERMEGGRS